MPDYGHDLEFGLFATPDAGNAEQVVDLAVVADQVGLDLISYQDHPYQAGFLDSSTLLAYVAAKTEHIRLAANVNCLPLRPPAVLARAAASMDILSGGRFELGLGAGIFWDAIASMGGKRVPPRQAVAALREAIALIRELWDIDQRGGLFFKGEHYVVDGARRGPRPHHDIPIWIGAYKPRMLALTGEITDGWVPSLEILPGGMQSIDEGNALIDDAAAKAGRQPTDVRRMLNIMSAQLNPMPRGILNGPPDAWVEQMATMALEHGISTFFIGGDDPRAAALLGAEIAPAVREVVARERS